MDRPRLLLVPGLALSELDWRIKPELEEWAEVASFDAPGVGDEPDRGRYDHGALVERGLAELESRGWGRTFVVGDDIGATIALLIATKRPDVVQGVVLGHPCLSLDRTRDRAAVTREMGEALTQVIRTDYRTHARHLSQLTQGAYDDEFAERYMERVPRPVAERYMRSILLDDPPDVDDALRSLDAPVLLVEHKGCLMWTRQGYEDAVAARPDGRTASLPVKPSASPELVPILRSFCEDVLAEEGTATGSGRRESNPH
jgi:pimeloyl-ACP methyl ester carboxylesterase